MTTELLLPSPQWAGPELHKETQRERDDSAYDQHRQRRDDARNTVPEAGQSVVIVIDPPRRIDAVEPHEEETLREEPMRHGRGGHQRHGPASRQGEGSLGGLRAPRGISETRGPFGLGGEAVQFLAR